MSKTIKAAADSTYNSADATTATDNTAADAAVGNDAAAASQALPVVAAEPVVATAPPALSLGESVTVLLAPGRVLRNNETGGLFATGVATPQTVTVTLLRRLADGDLQLHGRTAWPAG